MPKSKIREIALISLPIVFLGGFGWWANSRQQQRIARESGPYRTRLISIEDLTPTPFERWQGFDSKVRIVATDDGKPDLPANVKLGDRRALFGEMFQVSADGAKIPVVQSDVGLSDAPVQGYGADTTGLKNFNALQLYENSLFRSEKENLATTLLIDTHVANHIVRLEGNVGMQRKVLAPLSFVGKTPAGVKRMLNFENSLAFEARPLKLSRTLRPSQKSFNHQTPTISAKVIRLRPRDAAGGEETIVKSIFGASGLNENAGSGWRIFDAHIETERGETVWKNYLQAPGLSNGEFKENYFFHLATIPQEKGLLTLKAWASYRDSWPLRLSVVVRERVKTVVPRKLELQKAELVDLSTRPRVEVWVRYLGALPVEDENALTKGDYNFLMRRQDVPPRRAGTDRLVSDWSQRLELGNGKTRWQPQFVGYPDVSRVSKNTFVVTYPVPALKNWQSGQSARFRAQVGIEDDGFLDIDLPISGPK